MKTYPKQKIGSRAYIGESMVKILICDDDQTFAQSMFKRILSLPAYSSKSMKLSCLTDIAEMSANTIAQYDILFLDIDLGKESGIDLARKMRKMNPEAVKKWADALKQVSQNPKWIAGNANFGGIPNVLSPEDTLKFVTESQAIYADLVQKANLEIK